MLTETGTRHRDGTQGREAGFAEREPMRFQTLARTGGRLCCLDRDEEECFRQHARKGAEVLKSWYVPEKCKRRNAG